MQQVIYLRLYKVIWMVCSASSKKSTHLFFDEKPMPKVVLFQGVYELSRYKKARTMRSGPYEARDYLSGGWLSQSSA